MIKRCFNRLAEAWNNFTTSSRADRRYWYLVDHLAALEKRVEALEEANRSSKR